MTLEGLFPGLDLGPAGGIKVKGLAWDSRRVLPEEVFFALPGREHDGHRFIPQAVERGAVAVVGERELSWVPVPYLRVEDARAALALAAAAFYGHPTHKLTAIGVTGTNGKTTVVYLLGQLLPKCATLTTVRVEEEGLSCVTTPEAPDLQRVAARAVAQGKRFFAFEASSIGLAQRRLEGVRLAGAVFTGLTRDHLDFHRTMEDYLRAKLRLFGLLPQEGWGVVSAADPHADLFLAATPGEKLTYGISQGDVRAEGVSELPWGIECTLVLPDGRVSLRLPFPGEFNLENALAAAAVAHLLGLSREEIARGLSRATLPPGRLQRFRAGSGAEVVVDYAHTPDALARVLRLLRPRARRLVVVFGAAGDSDRGKRPSMGRVVGELADLAIVTTDNPKREDPLAIAEQVARGLEEAGADYEIELDRPAAICRALTRCRAGDILLIAGKGHERYQLTAEGKRPYSDAGFLVQSGLAGPV